MKGRFMALASAAAVCLVGAAFAPASSLAQDPILFVHGYSESASVWNTMIGRFEKDGYAKSALSAYSYNTSQSNKIDAEEVKSRVETLLKNNAGATKVDIEDLKAIMTGKSNLMREAYARAGVRKIVATFINSSTRPAAGSGAWMLNARIAT